MYNIEKDVPIPETLGQGGRGRPTKYPFKLMGIGDSFIVPFDEATNHKVRQRSCAAGKKLGMIFRTVAEKSGTRVFRLR